MATTKKYVSLEKLGLYNEKVKKVISDGDATALQSAKDYADGLAVNYDEAGAAATAEKNAKAYADGKDAAIAEAKKAGTDAAAAAGVADGKAVAAQNAADAAQADVDTLETYVGTIPETAEATNIVAYVQEKTAGIATDTALTELTGRVAQAETDIDNIEKDYLKAADKSELQGNIDTLSQTHATDKAALEASIKAITDDYLKGADKTALQDQITANANAITVLTDGVDAEKVDGVKDLIAYVDEHGTEVTGMKEDIADNAEAISGVAGRMDTAEGKITALETASSTHATKTYVDEADSALSGRIATLEGKFTEGEGSVEDMISDAVDAAIGAEETRVDGLLANKVDKVTGKGLSTNDLTNELKANYDAAYAHSQEAHAPANAQANIIESVKVNGTALTITDKAVDIAVPTDNAELTNGAGYLVANDIVNKADKATTLAGYGIADAYTAAQTDSAIATAVGQFVEVSEEEINALFA